jgi:hypothetical protein
MARLSFLKQIQQVREVFTGKVNPEQAFQQLQDNDPFVAYLDSLEKTYKDAITNTIDAITNTINAIPKKETGENPASLGSLCNQLQEQKNKIKPQNQSTELPQWQQRSLRCLDEMHNHLAQKAKVSYNQTEPYVDAQQKISLSFLHFLLKNHDTLLSECKNESLLRSNWHDQLASNEEENAKKAIIKQRRTKQHFKFVLTITERLMRQLAKKQHLDDVDRREIEALKTLKIVPENKGFEEFAQDQLVEKLNEYIDQQYKILMNLKQHQFHLQQLNQQYEQELVLALQVGKESPANFYQTKPPLSVWNRVQHWMHTAWKERSNLFNLWSDLNFDRQSSPDNSYALRLHYSNRFLAAQKAQLGMSLWEYFRYGMNWLISPLLHLPLPGVKFILGRFFDDNKIYLNSLLNEQRLNMPVGHALADECRETAKQLIQFKVNNLNNSNKQNDDFPLLLVLDQYDYIIADDSYSTDLLPIIKKHNQACEEHYTARFNAVRKTLKAIVEDVLCHVAETTTQESTRALDALIGISHSPDTDPETYALAMKLYLFFQQHSDGHTSILQNLYEQHFATNLDDNQNNNKGLQAKIRLENFSHELHAIFDEIQGYHFSHSANFSDALATPNLSDKAIKDATVLRPLKVAINRFTEKLNFEYRLMERKNVSGESTKRYEIIHKFLQMPDDRLFRNPAFTHTDAQKQDERKQKKEYTFWARAVSLILATGQALLSFYALHSLTMLFGTFTLPIAVLCSGATLYTNYNLFRGETFALFKQMFIKKDYTNGFTSKTGMIVIVGALASALVMSLTMAILVGLSVVSVFPGMQGYIAATLLCSTTFVGFTGLMYVSIAKLIKSVAGIYDEYAKIKRKEPSRVKALLQVFHKKTNSRFNTKLLASSGTRANFTEKEQKQFYKNLSTQEWNKIHEWVEEKLAISEEAPQSEDSHSKDQKEPLLPRITAQGAQEEAIDRMLWKKRMQFVLDCIFYGIFVPVSLTLLFFATVATLGAWHAEMDAFFITKIHLVSGLSHIVSLSIVCSLTALVEFTFNFRSIVLEAFPRWAGYTSKATFALGKWLFFDIPRGIKNLLTGNTVTSVGAVSSLHQQEAIDENIQGIFTHKTRESIYKKVIRFWRRFEFYLFDPMGVTGNAAPNGALVLTGTLTGDAIPVISLGQLGFPAFALAVINALSATVQSYACNANALDAFFQQKFPVDASQHKEKVFVYEDPDQGAVDIHSTPPSSSTQKILTVTEGDSLKTKIFKRLDEGRNNAGASEEIVEEKKGAAASSYQATPQHNVTYYESPSVKNRIASSVKTFFAHYTPQEEENSQQCCLTATPIHTSLRPTVSLY